MKGWIWRICGGDIALTTCSPESKRGREWGLQAWTAAGLQDSRKWE